MILMDRCRCEEYAAAVKKLKVYTVGTYRPDIIENFDRSQYEIAWIKNRVSLVDLQFLKPKAWNKVVVQQAQARKQLKECRQIEEMWCPYMTPYKLNIYDATS